MSVAAMVIGCLLTGSIVYCVLIIIAARDYLAQPIPIVQDLPPISVLKPLAGVDQGLETNLRSFFDQDHPEFELLFAVREADDPAIPVVQALQKQFPARASRLIVTGEPPYPNAKVFSLDRMLAASRHDLLVMSDSDIRIAPGFLTSLAAEFADPNIGLATCPYRAVAGRSLWSNLEAEGMNTDFLAGLLVARMIVGVKFAVGPTLAARKVRAGEDRRVQHTQELSGGRFRARQVCRSGGFRCHSIAQHRGAPYRERALERECRSPPALGSQHPPVAAHRLHRPALDSSAPRSPSSSVRSPLLGGRR